MPIGLFCQNYPILYLFQRFILLQYSEVESYYEVIKSDYQIHIISVPLP